MRESSATGTRACAAKMSLKVQTPQTTTMPATMREPCNGVHDMSNFAYPGVKLIITPRMRNAGPITFYRWESQEVSELLAAWKHLHSDLNTSDNELVLVRHGERLEYLAGWGSISGLQESWRNESDRDEVKPIHLEIMTEGMFQNFKKVKERNARFSEGLRARGASSIPSPGKETTRIILIVLSGCCHPQKVSRSWSSNSPVHGV